MVSRSLALRRSPPPKTRPSFLQTFLSNLLHRPHPSHLHRRPATQRRNRHQPGHARHPIHHPPSPPQRIGNPRFHLRLAENTHKCGDTCQRENICSVGTAALGCPVERSSTRGTTNPAPKAAATATTRK